METDNNRCRECGTKLIGKTAIDVGYCIPCYNMMMCDPDDEDFHRCDRCDGHDACEDFGCAIKSGLGHLIQRPLLILILFVLLSCSSTLQIHTVEPIKHESRFKKLFDEADRAFDREYRKSN